MSLFFILWLADFLFALKIVCVMVGICLVSFLIVTVACTDGYSSVESGYMKKLYKFFAWMGVIFTATLLAPKASTIYISLGANAIENISPEIANSESGKKAIKYLNMKLDEAISEDK